MGRLEKWIVHRAGVVGLSWPEGVADVSGVPGAILISIVSEGGLRGIGRSARGYIARALKVSVRELEALAAGKIRWIEDGHTVDLDRMSPYAIRAADSVLPTPIACRDGRGVPILGRVLEGGIVESFENWTPEDGPRLPVRYRGVADCFALELTIEIPPYPPGMRLAFRIIAPGELAADELALLTFSARESETRLHRARLLPPQSLQLTPDDRAGAACIIPLVDVLRAARVIDAR